MAREHPFLLAGEWQRSGRPLEARSPYNGEVVGVTFDIPLLTRSRYTVITRPSSSAA